MKNVLYLTHRVPFPPNRGDRIRTYNIIRFLGQRCRLHVVTFAEETPSPETHDELNKYCESLTVVPIGRTRWIHAAMSFAAGKTVTEGLFHSREFAGTVARLAAEVPFDAALASSSGIARYLKEPGLKAARHWTDLIDVDSQKWLDYASTSNAIMSQVYRREGQRLRTVEKQLAVDCERLTVVTDAEVQEFRSFSNDGQVSAVTNGVDLDFFQRPDDHDEQKKCVFVGVLNYKPNSDGVVWFCQNVWPGIREKHADASFEIVGRSPSPEVLALDEIPGVNVVGPVDDIRPYLWSASAVVTPMQISRGVQNKVLEAFACERPLVSSVAPLVGLEIEVGQHALQAETPAEWVQSIDRLFTDSNLREHMGKAARDWVVAHHHWDVCLREFSELLQDENTEQRELVVAGEEKTNA